MNKLERVCNTLKTQGGVMSQYANDYIEVTSCFGTWHKHCPGDSVLCYGFDLSTNEEVCRVCSLEVYEKWRFKNDYETTLFLLPKKESVAFSVETCLHDRF